MIACRGGRLSRHQPIHYEVTIKQPYTLVSYSPLVSPSLVLGRLEGGTHILPINQTDTGWYQIPFNGGNGFIPVSNTDPYVLQAVPVPTIAVSATPTSSASSKQNDKDCCRGHVATPEPLAPLPPFVFVVVTPTPRERGRRTPAPSSTIVSTAMPVPSATPLPTATPVPSATPVATAQPVNKPGSAQIHIRILGAWQPIRSAPSAAARTIGQRPDGIVVAPVARVGDWWQIDFASRIGYIPLSAAIFT